MENAPILRRHRAVEHLHAVRRYRELPVARRDRMIATAAR
jgi:hypothetical protein